MITIPSELLKRTNSEIKSQSGKSASLRDKEKFRKILKENKSKPRDLKKQSEEIPLHDFFSHKETNLAHAAKNQGEASCNGIAPCIPIAEKNSQSNSQSSLAIAKVDSPYDHFHPEVQELFERMMGEMVLLNASGVSQTTVTLSSSHLSSSPLYGLQILITEHSSAPKSFNVELQGTAMAQALIAPCIKSFFSNLEEHRYDFEIHRLEMTLKEEKSSLIKKVDSISSEEESV